MTRTLCGLILLFAIGCSRQSDTSLTASWSYESGARTGTLYANVILENNVWGLCSWDIADV